MRCVAVVTAAKAAIQYLQWHDHFVSTELMSLYLNLIGNCALPAAWQHHLVK
jgi:hypothetical protein